MNKDLNNPEYTSAQLVYLFLDRDFNLIESTSGSMMAVEEGILGSLAMEGLKAPSDGFLYIFAVNETYTPVDFDNLIVIHKTGTILEINDYYPFGLKWYSNGTSLNKYKFGGKELQTELNLNTYDFHARQQDPQLGRFWGVDPMASKHLSLTPFNYVFNNPALVTDPSGMDPSVDQVKEKWNGGWSETTLGFVEEWGMFEGITDQIRGSENYNDNLVKEGDETTKNASGLAAIASAKEYTFGGSLAASIWKTGFEAGANYTSPYAERGVTKAMEVAEAAKLNKYAKFAGRAGNIVTGVDAALSIKEFSLSDKKSWGARSKLGINLTISGIGQIRSPYAQGISIGLGIFETAGGFNGVYNYADYTQKTGVLAIPGTGFNPTPLLFKFN